MHAELCLALRLVPSDKSFIKLVMDLKPCRGRGKGIRNDQEEFWREWLIYQLYRTRHRVLLEPGLEPEQRAVRCALAALAQF